MKKNWRAKIIVIAIFTAVSTCSFATSSTDNSLLLAFGRYNTKSGEPKALPLLAINHIQKDNWFYPVINLSKKYDDYGTLRSGSCSNSFCIASGSQMTSSYPAAAKSLIISSQDQGKSWVDNNNVLRDNMTQDFSNSTAVSDCGTGFCVVAGGYQSQDGRHLPFLAVSSDKGNSWCLLEEKNLPHNFVSTDGFNSINCHNEFCVAAGLYNSRDEKRLPLIARSIDNGKTWIYSSQIVLPSDYEGYFHSGTKVSCNDNLCAMAATYTTKENPTDRPAIFISTDKGSTWFTSITKPDEAGKYANLSKVHCQETFCIAASAFKNKLGYTKPLLATIKDNGKSWFYPSTIMSELPTTVMNGSFSAVSCNTQVCLAVGNTMNFSEDNFIIIAKSDDSGKTWSYINTNYLSYALMNEVSCNENICFATGSKIDEKTGVISPYPYLISSNDNGKTWTESSSVLSKLPWDFKDGGFVGTHTNKQRVVNSI